MLLRNRRLVGLLLAMVVCVLVPYLTLARQPAPPPPQPLAPAPARIAPAPTLVPTLPPPTPQPTPTPALSMRATEGMHAITILMYHYVREVDATSDQLGFRLSVRPDRFAEQLGWLRANGYETVLMREVAACLRGVLLCPPRAVALTFDDGYADHATAALPALRRYGFRATFYVVTGFVGREGYMSWEHLEQLRDSGMEIGAHTTSHADLAALPFDEARAEIVTSRQDLERRLGISVVSFSYPTGSYTPELAQAVRDAGFTSAVTTAQAADPHLLYELPRRRVLGGETIEGFPWYFTPLEGVGTGERTTRSDPPRRRAPPTRTGASPAPVRAASWAR